MFCESSLAGRRGLDWEVEFGYHQQCNGYDLLKRGHFSLLQLNVMSISRSLQLYLNHLRVRNRISLARCLTDRGGIVQ